MFKRKKPLGLINQFKITIWPEKGFERNFLYYWKRLIRIPESPHSISMGFSVGVFIAFSPFIGLHIILCIFISWAFRVNILSSIIGTFSGNPLTYPIMWASSIGLGDFILRRQKFTYEKIELSDFFGVDFFISFFVGSLILGFLFAIICYFFIKYFIIIYKSNNINIKE